MHITRESIAPYICSKKPFQRRCMLSAPLIRISSRERLEKVEKALTYPAWGFDNAEEYWQDYLIRIEQMERGTARERVQVCRLPRDATKAEKGDANDGKGKCRVCNPEKRAQDTGFRSKIIGSTNAPVRKTLISQ